MQELIWGYVPILIAICISIYSAIKAFTYKSTTGYLLFTVILSLNIIVVYSLVLMVFGSAWPSFVPHILLGLSILLLFIQKKTS